MPPAGSMGIRVQESVEYAVIGSRSCFRFSCGVVEAGTTLDAKARLGMALSADTGTKAVMEKIYRLESIVFDKPARGNFADPASSGRDAYMERKGRILRLIKFIEDSPRCYWWVVIRDKGVCPPSPAK
jgi:hypothetical protein